MTQQSIELHIEDLVLHGVPGANAGAIRDEVVRELTRLLSTEGLSPAISRPGEVTRVDGGTFDVGRDSGDEIRLANAIHTGLKK